MAQISRCQNPSSKSFVSALKQNTIIKISLFHIYLLSDYLGNVAWWSCQCLATVVIESTHIHTFLDTLR